MEEVKVWNELNLRIIEAIKNDNNDILDELFEKRQEILEKVDIKEFKKALGDNLQKDNEIQNLLSQEIQKVKQEIQKYKITQKANYNYKRNSNNKINLFNKKI